MALFTLYFNLLTSNEFRGPHFNNCDQMHLRSKLPKTEWFAMPNTCNSKTKSQDYKYVITTTKLQSECLEIAFSYLHEIFLGGGLAKRRLRSLSDNI